MEIDATDVWAALTELAQADGVAPAELEGCWERKLDEHWRILLNAHNEPKRHGDIEVPAFNLYVEFNGFPAGLLSPFGGALAAGSEANERTLSAALRAAVGTPA